MSFCGFWTAFILTCFQTKTSILEQKHITKEKALSGKQEHGHCEAAGIKEEALIIT